MYLIYQIYLLHQIYHHHLEEEVRRTQNLDELLFAQGAIGTSQFDHPGDNTLYTRSLRARWAPKPTGSFRKNVKSKMFVKISIFTKNQFSQLF